jgi:translation initiation factor 1
MVRYRYCSALDLIEHLSRFYHRTNHQYIDPFKDTEEDFAQTTKTPTQQHIHIRVQKRTGIKTLTTIQGLNPKLDFKKLLKAFKKEFCCNGTIVDDPELGKILQLTGDQRSTVSKFLVEEGIASKSNIKIHGF